jgi:hypothetical protein
VIENRVPVGWMGLGELTYRLLRICNVDFGRFVARKICFDRLKKS